jgi:predicted metal-dependent hydrolase
MDGYLLKRSKRKTLRLEITPDLQVVVRAPLFCPRREIDRFVARHAGWADAHLEQMKQRLAEHPPVHLTPAEEDALRQQAQAYLPGRVAYYGALMNLRPEGVKITGAKTRFGSCSAKNRLCFSFYLMLCPPEAADLVVVHELAHLRHKNHGPAFYALLASVLPDYRERKKLLKIN